MSVTPHNLDLEDVESGRIRRVHVTDPNLQTGTTDDTASRPIFEDE